MVRDFEKVEEAHISAESEFSLIIELIGESFIELHKTVDAIVSKLKGILRSSHTFVSLS